MTGKNDLYGAHAATFCIDMGACPHHTDPIWERGGSMIGLKKTPLVMCPGCDKPMQPRESKPILFAVGMTDVTYVCDDCHTSTTRTIRSDGELTS